MFLDETGSDVTTTRRRARAPRGQPAYGAVPLNRGKNPTVVGAFRTEARGVVTSRAVEGAMTGKRFLAFVVEPLIPVLSPGDVIEQVRRWVERCGYQLTGG